MKKTTSLWIVTEGLAGTDNQALGVAEALGLEAELKHVTLKQPWRALSPYLGLEHARIFTPALQAPWPDIALFGGRKSIAAARYIKHQSPQTLCVFLQDPRIHPSEFDLVIAPAHDDVNGSNVVKTIAAPNRITPALLKQAAEGFPDLNALPAPRIAMMIGGNSKAHRFTEVRARALAEQLKVMDASLMITFSRRTPLACEFIMRDALRDHFIWDGSGDNPYFAMLALADTLMVTEDSASMLSEAASTGKPTYMIPLAGGGRRIAKMQDTLITHGAVRRFEGVIESWTYTPLRDAALAAEAIRAYMNSST